MKIEVHFLEEKKLFNAGLSADNIIIDVDPSTISEESRNAITRQLSKGVIRLSVVPKSLSVADLVTAILEEDIIALRKKKQEEAAAVLRAVDRARKILTFDNYSDFHNAGFQIEFIPGSSSFFTSEKLPPPGTPEYQLCADANALLKVFEVQEVEARKLARQRESERVERCEQQKAERLRQQESWINTFGSELLRKRYENNFNYKLLASKEFALILLNKVFGGVQEFVFVKDKDSCVDWENPTLEAIKDWEHIRDAAKSGNVFGEFEEITLALLVNEIEGNDNGLVNEIEGIKFSVKTPWLTVLYFKAL